MNPKALAELVPDFEKSAPLDTPVTDSAALLFTKNSSFRFPITPPPFQNKGNYVISLSKLTKWLGGLVEAAGVNVFKEFGGAQLIYEGDGIAGVITEDKGLDKNGKPKDNYTPGYELRAKVTVLAEGPRGSLTKDLVATKKLDNINPQSYGIGIKELWDIQPDRIQPGYVAHTLGWPVPTSMYGGGWIYGLSNNRLSIGLVLALEYADPQFDPHAAFQTWKTHPFLKKILEGGKLVRYGAKSLPYGGWYAMPRTYVDGALIIGDSGSFLDSQRLKGIHMAMKSGMLAAETIFESLKTGDATAKTLSAFPQKIEQSYIKKELWQVRNFHQSFQHGMLGGFIHTAFQQITGGRGLIDPMHAEAGYKHYKKINGRPAPERFKGDGKLTFDRLTDVYHSGTRHEEDQPCHLHVADTQHLFHKMRGGIRQSLPVFLSRGSLRNGERSERRSKTEDQRRQLRPLQNLRHRRSLPNHQLGRPRRRRWPQLRRHVAIFLVGCAALHCGPACPGVTFGRDFFHRINSASIHKRQSRPESSFRHFQCHFPASRGTPFRWRLSAR